MHSVKNSVSSVIFLWFSPRRSRDAEKKLLSFFRVHSPNSCEFADAFDCPLISANLFFNHRERREDAKNAEGNLCALCEKLRDLCGFSLVFTAEALRRREKVINVFFRAHSPNSCEFVDKPAVR